MNGIGRLPQKLNGHLILENIQETMIIADKDYRVQWMNARAIETLQPVLPIYQLSRIEELIGKHMDFFHSNSEEAEKLLTSLHTTYRTRITIGSQYVAEAVIHPIDTKDGERYGYLLMLLDFTDQAEAELEKERLIEDLSTPLLKIWDEVLAVPITGKMDIERGKKLTETVLEAVVKEQARYLLIDLSSLHSLDEEHGYYINTLHDALRLIGTTCLIVGLSSKMALSLVDSQFNWRTFSTVQQSISYILEKKNCRIAPIS